MRTAQNEPVGVHDIDALELASQHTIGPCGELLDLQELRATSSWMDGEPLGAELQQLLIYPIRDERQIDTPPQRVPGKLEVHPPLAVTADDVVRHERDPHLRDPPTTCRYTFII
jgi:hypothetical protein